MLRQECFDSGKQEGYEQGKLDDARNMLAENVSEAAIARYTGLSVVKVRELAEELKSEMV